MQSQADININLIKLIEKYFVIINQALTNQNLFKFNFPGAQTLFEISNAAFKQIFNNPLHLMQSTFEYQLHLTQQILGNTNTLEIINKTHTQLHYFYQKLIDGINLNNEDKQYLLFFIKQFFHATTPDNFLFLNENKNELVF